MLPQFFTSYKLVYSHSICTQFSNFALQNCSVGVHFMYTYMYFVANFVKVLLYLNIYFDLHTRMPPLPLGARTFCFKAAPENNFTFTHKCAKKYALRYKFATACRHSYYLVFIFKLKGCGANILTHKSTAWTFSMRTCVGVRRKFCALQFF